MPVADFELCMRNVTRQSARQRLCRQSRSTWSPVPTTRRNIHHPSNPITLFQLKQTASHWLATARSLNVWERTLVPAATARLRHVREKSLPPGKQFVKHLTSRGHWSGRRHTDLGLGLETREQEMAKLTGSFYTRESCQNITVVSGKISIKAVRCYSYSYTR